MNSTTYLNGTAKQTRVTPNLWEFGNNGLEDVGLDRHASILSTMDALGAYLQTIFEKFHNLAK